MIEILKKAGLFLKRGMRGQASVLVSLFLFIILLFIPTGYEGAVIYKDKIPCRVEILEVNNDKIIDTGLVRSGEQTCHVLIKSGKFKGCEADGYNLLNGSLENDKIFAVGDVALAAVSYDETGIRSVNLIDHFRIHWELLLSVLFIIVLCSIAGVKGVRAILSFVVTVLVLWKILIPFSLNGVDPIVSGFIITAILTVIIISLVYGFEKRTIAAVSGAMLGLLVTAVMGIIFTQEMKIHGAIMPNSEGLLYSGFQNLNLTRIFMASIFIGSSGAVMDLSVDITSAVYEVVDQNPSITWKNAVRSGMNVARAAMGTMTTTLLLAYSGGNITQLMVFMAQGTPLYCILNYKYISAQILNTIVGSMGLATVAPLTALCAGVLFTKKKNIKMKQ